MEFRFPLAYYLGAPPDGVGPHVGCVDEELLRGKRGRDLCTVLEELGKASAAAQGLRKPVTFGTPHLLDQRIYLLAEGCTALGFLKVGAKRLFVAPPAGGAEAARSDVRDALREVSPVCALDFYVHESCQRHGYGRRIFDAMLQGEGLRPEQLAYDRPSPKFLGFLAKHFGLTKFRPQNNNYVLFDEFFWAGHGGPCRPQASGPGRGGWAPGACGPPSSGSRGILPLGPPEWPEASQALPQRAAARPPMIPSQSYGAPVPWQPRERGHTPRGAASSAGSTSAGSFANAAGALEPPFGTDAHVAAGRPSSGCEGQGGGLLAAGMPSRGLSRRAASVPSRGSSAGADPGGSGLWGRSTGSSANRFASPLSHAGQSLVMR